jgi:hypothetical protein
MLNHRAHHSSPLLMLATATAIVALTGCGKQVSINPDPATQGAAGADVSHLTRSCGEGGPAMWLTLGWSTCGGAATLANPSYLFSIGKTDYLHIQAGASFPLVGDMHAPAFGYRITGGTADTPITVSTIAKATETPITAGLLKFDTFEADRAATGTYEVVYPGGEAHGTFAADFCLGMACIP